MTAVLSLQAPAERATREPLLELVRIEFAFAFPPLNLLITLVGTVLLALLMRIPLRRVVRFKPGEALRYA